MKPQKPRISRPRQIKLSRRHRIHMLHQIVNDAIIIFATLINFINPKILFFLSLFISNYNRCLYIFFRNKYKLMDNLNKALRQKLNQLNLTINNETAYFKIFKEPQSLYSKFKDLIVSHEKSNQENDSFYITVLQSFMKSKQLFQSKNIELIQAWIIYQIKVYFKFKLSVEKMVQVSAKIFNQKKITVKRCVQEIAKKDIVQQKKFLDWKAKQKDQIDKFEQNIISNLFYRQFVNKKTMQIQQKQQLNRQNTKKIVQTKKIQQIRQIQKPIVQKANFYLLQLEKEGQLLSLQYDQLSQYPNMLQLHIQTHILSCFLKIYQLTSNHNKEYYYQKLNKYHSLQLKSISDIKLQIEKQKRQMSQKSFQILNKLQTYLSKKEDYSGKEQVQESQLSKYRECLRIWSFIKQELNVLNIFLLQHLIKNTEQSIKHIKDKNILFLIGPSGAGKTTTILRLLNYELQQVKVNGLSTLVPKYKLKPQHTQLITSPQAKSTTKYIFSAKIDPEYVPKREVELEQQTIFVTEDLYLCDTPGFFDTSGAAVDIANGVGMINAVRFAKTVKPIIVISASMVGEKFQGIKQIGKIVSDLFYEYRLKEQGSSTQFIFNKFATNEQFNRIQPGLLSILKNLSANQQSDGKYVRFLQVLYDRLKKKKNILRFNPFEIDVKEMINKLSQNPIENPNKSFKYSFSTKSVLTLKNYYQNKFNVIVSLLSEDINHACYHIKQVKTLLSIVQNQDYEKDFKALIQKICHTTKQYFQRFKFIINENVLKNQVNTSTIEQLKHLYDRLKAFRAFSCFPDILAYSQEDSLNLIKNVTTSLQQTYQSYEFTNARQAQYKKIIKIIKCFSQNFNPQLQKSLKEYIQKKYISQLARIEQFVLANKFTNKFKECYEVYDNICAYCELLHDNSKVQKAQTILDKKYESLKKNIKLILQNLKNKLDSNKQLQNLIPSLQKDYNTLQQLSSLNIYAKIKQQNLKQLVLQQTQNFIKTICSKCEQIVSLKEISENNIVDLRRKLEYLEIFKQFTKIKQQSQMTIKSIKYLIKRSFELQMSNLQKITSSIINKQISSKIVQLDQTLFKIRNYEEFVDFSDCYYEQNSIQQMEDTFFEEFHNFYYNLKEKIQDTKINIKGILKLDEITIIIRKAKQLKYLRNIKQNFTKDQLNQFKQYPQRKCYQILLRPYKQISQCFSYSNASSIKITKQLLNFLSTFIEYDLHLNKMMSNKDYQQKIIPAKKQNYQHLIKKFINQFKKQITDHNRQINKKQNLIYNVEKEALNRLKKTFSLFFYAMKDENILCQMKRLQFQEQFKKIQNEIIDLIQKTQNILLQQLCQNQNSKQFEKSLEKIKRCCLDMKEFDAELGQQNNFSQILKIINNQYAKKQQLLSNKLVYIFTQSNINYQQLKEFFTNNQGNPEIIQEIINYIKRFDKRLCQEINGMKKYYEDLKYQDQNLNYVALLNKAYVFYQQITDIIQAKVKKIQLNLNTQYFKSSLDQIVHHYEYLYKKIIDNIQKLKFKSFPQKIQKFFETLQYLTQKVMPERYADIKKKIVKIKFNEDFNLNCYIPQDKSITYRIRKYNQVLMDAIETDFTTVINIFKQSSIKFYNYLEGKRQKRYLQLLKDRFDDSIQKYWQDSKNGEEDEQCLKELFKVIPQPLFKGQLQSQFQEIKDEVQSNKRQIENKFKQQSQSNNFNEMVNIYNRMNRNDQSRFKNQLLKAIKDDFQQITSANTPQIQRIQKYRYVCEKYENHPTVTQMFSQRYQELKQETQQAMIGQIQALINQNEQQIRNIDTAVQIGQLIQNNKVITDSYIEFIQRNINVFQNILTKIQDYFGIVIYKHSEYSSSTSESQIFTICNWKFEQVEKQITKQYFLKQIAKPIINELTYSRSKIQIFRNSEKIRDILSNEYQNTCLYSIASQILIIHKQVSKITFPMLNITSSINSVEESCKKYLQELREKISLLRNIEPIYIKYGLSNLKIEGNTNKISDLSSFKKNISKQVNKGIQQINKLQKNPQKQLSIRFNLIYTLCNFWITNHENQLSEFMINIYKNLIQSLQKVFQDFQNLIDSFNLFIRAPSKGIFTTEALDKLSKSQLQFCNDQNNIQKAQIIIANLVIMQKMQTRLYFYQQNIKEKTVSMVQSIKKIRYLFTLVIRQMKNKLGVIPEINAIARKYAVFQPVLQVQKAEKKDIKHFLFQLKNNHKKFEHNIDFLLKDYQSFEQSFRKTLSRYGQNKSKQTIEAISKGIYNSLQQQKCQIIGKILGLYSILKIKCSNQLNFRPHLSQFVATSLLISFDYKQSSPKLNRNVLQMLPGEGKSLVIAITACYLALKGYKVYQICYSKYLVNRDYQEFKQLFKVLDIQKNIKYNTISSLCKQIVIPIKQLMQKELVDPSPKQKGWLDVINKKFATIGTSLTGHSTNVILIDQIDILFSNQIQGKIYEPTLSISDGNTTSEIMNIIEQIYNRSKTQYLILDSLQKTQAYADLLNKYPRISQILKFQIIRMLNDVLDQHKINDYYQDIKRGKQNQRQQGFDGYHLQFAYIKLKQNNKSSQKNIKNNLKIYFKIGKFSYCQLIKNYGKIVGVGGALKCLSEINQQSLGKQYNIQNVYYLPSIYKLSSLIQKQSIIEYKQKEVFYRSIYKQIKSYFQNNDDSQKAIIVFFNNRQELQYFNYICSTQIMLVKNFALKYLISELQMNENNISKVTCKNILTLATKQYSRGIDYKDLTLTNGLFVIQTYLPDNLQDYHQAKGRTARQGRPGNFKLIVSDYELSKIQKGMERFIKEPYNFWKQRSQQNNKVRSLQRKQAKRLHEKTLNKYQSRKAMQYLQKINIVQIKKFEKQIFLIFGFQGNLTNLEQYKKCLIQDLQRLEYIINKYTLPINLKYQICYFGNYTNQNLQNILKTSKISSLHSFKQEMRNMEPFQRTNKLHYIGESIQLFFNYVSKLSQKEKVSSCFVFSSQRNYSWNVFKNTQRFKRYGLDLKKILKIGRQIKSCQQQLKYIKSKNISMNFIGLNCQVQSKRQIQQYSRYLNQKKLFLHIRQLNNFKPQLNKFFFQKVKQIIPYLKGKQI